MYPPPEEEIVSPPETDFEEIPAPETAPAPDSAPETDQPALFFETREGKLLSQLIEDLERPEETIRSRMVQIWKKMENYWRDRQYIIWDEFASDWRTPSELKDADSSIDIDPAAYAKIINIYKAHGQAIISALSAGLPYVRFFPDDADNQEDVFTAKSYSKLAELIQKRNKGQLLFVRSLFLLWNCGTAFAYNENMETREFGTYEKPRWKDVPVINRQNFCSNCGMMLSSEQIDIPEEGQTASDGTPLPPEMGQESVQPPNALPPQSPEMGMEQGEMCPRCGMQAPPLTEDYEEMFPRQVGVSEEPKTHEVIEIFSGLSVKIPHWVTKQSQTPYLSLETEEHIALLKEIYPEVADKIQSSSDDPTFERQARRNADYKGDTPQHLATLKRSWIRPWAFNHLDSLDDVTYLKGLYPDGVYIAKINDLIVEAVKDKLDDHWTATIDPLSNYLHSDPLAQSLVPVQDITNELTNLTLETVEFGIPETFYESDAIDSEKYSLSEARPGMMYPAKSRNGMGLDSQFHTVKTAALSQEVDTFADRMTQAGQFVSGAFPTIWGGAMEGGGGTAKEYEQSRSMALQRLNLTWLCVKAWWADVMAKSVRSFAVNMKTDEKFVKPKGNSFINVWIKRAEMAGKVGQVEPDISEAFPISWSQKRDILMALINMKNPMIESVIAHPENASMVAGTVGFPELYIPGDDDRNKQLWEISQLLMGQPTPSGAQGPDGQEAMQPTIPVDEWDNHQVEAEVCKAWLKSEVGIDTKTSNPAGYMNVVSHMKMHDFQVQQAMMQEAQAQQGEDNATDKKETGSEQPPSRG